MVPQDQIQRCGKEAKEWRQRRSGITTPTSNQYNLVKNIRALKKKIHKAAVRTESKIREILNPSKIYLRWDLHTRQYNNHRKPTE